MFFPYFVVSVCVYLGIVLTFICSNSLIVSVCTECPSVFILRVDSFAVSIIDAFDNFADLFS